MKKANEIINHILYPYKDKISKQRCLKKIISLLPLKYNKYIVSMHIKGDFLIINVSHPAIKQELFYNKNLIFSIIKTMHSAGICKEIKPVKIITNYKYESKKQKNQKIYKFYIKPAGKFKINAKNEKIKNKFTEIRNILQSLADKT